MTTISDLKWAAGFLEGEGSFYSNKKSASLHVSANQVERWPLDQLHEMFGGRIRIRKSQHINWKDQWHWETNGVRAAGIMMSLYFFLSPKRKQQIKDALNRWKSRQAAPGLKTACGNGHPYLPANLAYSIVNGKRTRRCITCRRKNSTKWNVSHKEYHRVYYKRHRLRSNEQARTRYWKKHGDQQSA